MKNKNILSTGLEELDSIDYDDYIALIHDKWIDVNNRELWMHGIESFDTIGSEGEEPGIEYSMATKIIKNLHILRQSNEKSPILIHMHTCGGVVEEGLALYDAIKSMPYKVTIISYTHARSMSSIILQAADDRILLPHSYFLFHRGDCWYGGEANRIKHNFKWAEKQEEKMLDIYIKSMKTSNKFKNKSNKELKKVLNDRMNKETDVFMTPQEAINWGFADKILRRF